MKTYSEKLKDPRWQQKRLKVMERDGWACVDCGEKKKSLSVHHSYYVTGRMPWMYPMWSLQTLCSDCHKERHENVASRVTDAEENEDETGHDEWEEIVGFLCRDKPEDLTDWWDIAVMLAQRSDEFEKRKIRPVDWIDWGCHELARMEYLRELPAFECPGCKDPMPDPSGLIQIKHTCGKQ